MVIFTVDVNGNKKKQVKCEGKLDKKEHNRYTMKLAIRTTMSNLALVVQLNRSCLIKGQIMNLRTLHSNYQLFGHPNLTNLNSLINWIASA